MKPIITKEMADLIHDSFDGCADFHVSSAGELVGIPDLDQHYDDAELMDICGLEYCELCGWVFSLFGGCGESSEFDMVCVDCGDPLDD